MTIHTDQKLAVIMSRFIQKILMLDRNERAAHGVTLTQHYTIAAIHRRGTLSMNELSASLNLALSTLTRIIDILVRDGIVAREPSPQDRRKVCVVLTKKGKALADQLNKGTEIFWSRISQAIPESQKKNIIENIRTLIEAIDIAEEGCCPNN